MPKLHHDRARGPGTSDNTEIAVKGPPWCGIDLEIASVLAGRNRDIKRLVGERKAREAEVREPRFIEPWHFDGQLWTADRFP